MSWAAHEFEMYFIEKHLGAKASWFGIVVGTYLPDLFTKAFVYTHESEAAHFHRGWPGLGFSHSFAFGVVLAALVLWLTKSRAWALGLLIGQWAHVLTDMSDTAGVMIFFPFSTETLSIHMWKHAAAKGRFGDAAAYYSGLGGIWDFFWFLMVIIFARSALRADYFRDVVLPADPKVWAWMKRRLWLTDNGLLVAYRALFLYATSRMIAWFIYARFQAKAPWEPVWDGPKYVPGHYLAYGSGLEILVRLAIGGVVFFAALYLSWITFGRRLWRRAAPPPGLVRARPAPPAAVAVE